MKRFKAYTLEKGLIETNDYSYVIDLTWHREDGPAYTRYYQNGNIAHESYWVIGRRHRLDGPAVISCDETGNIIDEVYYINDVWYNKDKYHKELLKLKVQSL